MALISSESMTLMVNGTLQSEFLTMFCPMRFTYSVTTGSVMNLVLFSICAAYILPILVSESVEYQFPTPRPPISRLPTAFTSSMEPGFTFTFWLPGSITLSGLTVLAGISPPTGVVPGAGLSLGLGVEELVDEDFSAEVSPPTGVVPGAGWAVGVLAGGVFCWAVLVGVDCAQAATPRANTKPAKTNTLDAIRTVFIPSPPA